LKEAAHKAIEIANFTHQIVNLSSYSLHPRWWWLGSVYCLSVITTYEKGKFMEMQMQGLKDLLVEAVWLWILTEMTQWIFKNGALLDIVGAIWQQRLPGETPSIVRKPAVTHPTQHLLQ
jgi:hypothetical protein